MVMKILRISIEGNRRQRTRRVSHTRGAVSLPGCPAPVRRRRPAVVRRDRRCAPPAACARVSRDPLTERRLWDVAERLYPADIPAEIEDTSGL